MGGGSAQIVALPTSAYWSDKPVHSLKALRELIYVKSYLGYGASHMEKRMLRGQAAAAKAKAKARGGSAAAAAAAVAADNPCGRVVCYCTMYTRLLFAACVFNRLLTEG